MISQVIDNFSCTTEDLNRVEKFEISEEEYAKKTGKTLAFILYTKLVNDNFLPIPWAM